MSIIYGYVIGENPSSEFLNKENNPRVKFVSGYASYDINQPWNRNWNGNKVKLLNIFC